MNGKAAVGLLVAAGLGLGACSNPYDPGQRAVGGGVLGAGTGAALGAIAGGGRGAAIGALAGGALGAVGGAATTPNGPERQPYYAPQPGYQQGYPPGYRPGYQSGYQPTYEQAPPPGYYQPRYGY